MYKVARKKMSLSPKSVNKVKTTITQSTALLLEDVTNGMRSCNMMVLLPTRDSVHPAGISRQRMTGIPCLLFIQIMVLQEVR